MAEKRITAVEVKRINRNHIYKLIYREEEISRQEIAGRLGLSLPTVNQNLKELQAIGLIDYKGSFESTGGRKPKVIIPVKQAKVSVGIDIRKNYVCILLIDLYGNILDYEKYTKVFSEKEEYGQFLSYLVKNILSHNGWEAEKVLGVGIAIPGVFDKSRQKILLAPSLGISNFPVENLTKHMEYPCIVDNDGKAGAYAELWSKPDSEAEIYLLIDKGVGGCIIYGNGLYKGEHNRGGEFGHMTLYPDGKQCACGKRGCFEAYVSVARLSDDLDCQLEDFFAGLAGSNEVYQKIWNQYMENLCVGINSLYMTFDSKIVLSGVLSQYLEPYISQIRGHLAELNSFDADGEYLRLSKYHRRAAAVGAALEFAGEFIDNI
ncbi:ROK family transcriptional regulator [Anaeromicropila populeti]|uniref:Sugar kinase of the NBD/HSP70 family, may contain an N-terminal HTH domain n=1 Tax=Anaeromicropila populeti TaxID=37658 RepID=A0A1I6LU39_9FIRM|nr:ROK family transcriptional regulator [Anaeromicropila populeti]SFS06989.1 Sugar kinase of the NBD/HSP70 family, may contain an N-terminal HTH domain [Anaeromicropila populeti]